MKNSIILIGYMGCGKSTIGRKMVELFQLTFVDTDSWIEEKEGITVSEIFAAKGEPYFRNLETECLKELLKKSELENSEKEYFKKNGGCGKKVQVISVGGGLPVGEENRRLLKQLGEVIYLKAAPETVYERIKGDTTRPLLQTENPLQKIKDMLNAREEKYQMAAHRVINVDGKSITDIIREITGKDGK